MPLLAVLPPSLLVVLSMVVVVVVPLNLMSLHRTGDISTFNYLFLVSSAPPRLRDQRDPQIRQRLHHLFGAALFPLPPRSVSKVHTAAPVRPCPNTGPCVL